MARDIKATPIIRGKDAVIFYKKLEENKSKKADKDTMLRIEQSVRFFKSAHKEEV
jgi:hypothetical protein